MLALGRDVKPGTDKRDGKFPAVRADIKAAERQPLLHRAAHGVAGIAELENDFVCGFLQHLLSAPVPLVEPLALGVLHADAADAAAGRNLVVVEPDAVVVVVADLFLSTADERVGHHDVGNSLVEDVESA